MLDNDSILYLYLLTEAILHEILVFNEVGGGGRCFQPVLDTHTSSLPSPAHRVLLAETKAASGGPSSVPKR